MSSIKALRNKTVWIKTAPAMLLVLNSFVWYIFTYPILSQLINGLNLVNAVKLGLFAAYFLGVTISAIIGSILIPPKRTISLYLWLFAGSGATLLLFIIPTNSAPIIALFSFFIGISAGIGLPSCLSYFAHSTSPENRGVIGGVIWSMVGFLVLLFAFLTSILSQSEMIILLAVWRFFGGAVFLFMAIKRSDFPVQKSPIYSALIRKKEVLLYLVPWIMLCLINFAEAPILESHFGPNFDTIQLVEWAIVGIVAVGAGIIADTVGRKRIVLAGFVMLGIEYAILSTFYSAPITLYLFLILDGTTWGFLFSAFFTAIWGDLAENYEKEKYYVLGGLPYLLSNFMYVLVKPIVSDISLIAAFSFASFFLFLAVIPLMYAPETLPEKSIKERELKSYLEKAQKFAEKETEKNNKRDVRKTKKENEEANEETQESPEYEEARKLAEKYY